MAKNPFVEAADAIARGEEIVVPPAAPAKDTGEEPLTPKEWAQGVTGRKYDKGAGSSAKGTGSGGDPATVTPDALPEEAAATAPAKKKAEKAKTVQEIQEDVSTKLMKVADLRDQLETANPDQRVMLRGLVAKTDAEIVNLQEQRRDLMTPGAAQAAPWTPTHTKAVALLAPVMGLPGFRPEKVDDVSELMTLEGAGQYAREAAEFAKAGGEPARSRSAYFTPTPTSLSGSMTDLTPVATLKTTVDRVNKRKAEIKQVMNSNREYISRAKAELKRLEASTTPDFNPLGWAGAPALPGSMIAMPLTEKHRTAEADKKDAEQWLKDLNHQNKLLEDERSQLNRIERDMMTRLAATSSPKE